MSVASRVRMRLRRALKMPTDEKQVVSNVFVNVGIVLVNKYAFQVLQFPFGTAPDLDHLP